MGSQTNINTDTGDTVEQLLVRIYDTELAQFYMKYREAQAGAVFRAFPPNKRSVNLPLAKTVARIEAGLYFYVELTRHDSGERLCALHVDAQSYQNDLAAHLAWEPEAVEFIDGFLQWLTSNFRTDAPQTVTPEAKSRKLEDVVLEAMRLYPDKQGRMSQAAWNYIFEHFEGMDGAQPDKFAIAASTGKDIVTVRKAKSRYEQDKQDRSHET